MARPRPVAVYYPGGGLGHCSSVKTAIARATLHLLNLPPSRSAQRINVLYEGDPVADLTRSGNHVDIRWIGRKLEYPL